MIACRCGWAGEADHPCHGAGYTCRKPAKQRFYRPRLVALSGITMKVEVTDTWACDGCWSAYLSAQGATDGSGGTGTGEGR